MDMDEKLKIYAEYAVKHDITALIGITTLCLAFIRRMQDEYGPWLVDRLRGTKYEHKVRSVMDDNGKLNLNELWPNLRQLIAGGIEDLVKLRLEKFIDRKYYVQRLQLAFEEAKLNAPCQEVAYIIRIKEVFNQ